jgi:Tol biopolymer transport system component/Ca2+-binding RTX toxin-like protein
MALSRFLTSVVVVALLGALLPVRPVIAAPTCFGKRATIVGTNRDPIKSVDLNGTPGKDVIVGVAGTDRIDGRGGDDLICGGGGDDYVKAGAGNDKVKGQNGLDTLNGGSGDDQMWGGPNSDALVGGRGKDRLFGGADTEDSLIGGPGNDFMDGGPGYDLAEFWDSPAGIEADLRTDTATGHGQDRIVSIEGIVASNFDDVLFGDDQSNMFQGGDGNDIIRALGSDADGGVDILRSSGGDNILDGGDGPDIASYNQNPWGVTADLSAGTTASEFGTDTLTGIEHLVGSRENDTLIGDDGDNIIFGSAGDDIMDGRGGVDEVAFDDSRMPVTADLGAGTAEADWWGSDTFVNFENMAGSSWRDVLMGDDGGNLIRGWGRNDIITGLGGDDQLIGGLGTDQADGGDGTDECEAEVHNCEFEILSVAGASDPWSARSVTSRWDLWARSLPPQAAGATPRNDDITSSAGGGESNWAESEPTNEDCLPAKARLAFVRDLGGSVGFEIFTVRPDGSGLRRLTDNNNDEWGPAWSPDGTRIAFSSTRDGNSEIYVMDRTGGDVTHLTENDASDGVPAWSPDGTKIAFSSSRDDPEDIMFDLYVMDADGGNVRKVVGGPAQEWNATWSPNGRRLAFDRNGSIFTVRSDGTDLKKLTSRRRMDASNSSWSHDGRRILFQAQKTEERGMDIFVMRRDGTNKTPLVAERGEQQTPSWSPNDRRIAFSDNWRVARSRADGSGIVTLFDHDLADYAVDWGRGVRC